MQLLVLCTPSMFSRRTSTQVEQMITNRIGLNVFRETETGSIPKGISPACLLFVSTFIARDYLCAPNPMRRAAFYDDPQHFSSSLTMYAMMYTASYMDIMLRIDLCCWTLLSFV